jgi:diadenosine tetraphosphate (Ap4A) HIT family hydrolase
MQLPKTAQQFHDAFHAGIESLLKAASPSASQLVLALAHAIMLEDRALIARVRPLAQPYLHRDPDSEDEQVLQFALTQPDPLALIRRRTTPGRWTLQLNELRTRRPLREGVAAATRNHQPFDPAKFNYSKLAHEIFWQAEIAGQTAAFYYNKYPVQPYHTLIVPDPVAGKEQFLQRAVHDLAWQLAAHLRLAFPELALGYSSLGSNASVNHLHFHLVPDARPFPLLSQDPAGYLIPVHEHRSPDSAWAAIDELQRTNRPFVLIYTPGRMLLIPRRFQGSYEQPTWTHGFAWGELAGGIIVHGTEAFATITDADIEAAIRAVVPEPKNLAPCRL